MFAMLWYMLWFRCEFGMWVGNVLHAARCKYRMHRVARDRYLAIYRFQRVLYLGSVAAWLLVVGVS